MRKRTICKNIPTRISLCLTTVVFSQQGGISVFKFRGFRSSLGQDLTLFTFIDILVYRPDCQPIGTLYPCIRKAECLASSASHSHSLSDPTTLKTPPGDYATQNFS